MFHQNRSHNACFVSVWTRVSLQMTERAIADYFHSFNQVRNYGGVVSHLPSCHKFEFPICEPPQEADQTSIFSHLTDKVSTFTQRPYAEWLVSERRAFKDHFNFFKIIFDIPKSYKMILHFIWSLCLCPQ